jgi:MFS family permease
LISIPKYLTDFSHQVRIVAIESEPAGGHLKKTSIAPLFYFGTLVSSIGSFAFNVALIAFMLKNGFHLGHASLIIGLQRLVPVLTTGFWGHLTDRLPSSLTVAFAEIIAGFSSVAIFLIWQGSQTNYSLLVILCVTRSIVVAFQAGSRCKITKIFSDHTYAGNSRNAIWLNKATQGATLFGGLVAWFLIRHFNFETAIALDGFTFLLNGLIAVLIPNFDSIQEKSESIRSSWTKKFHELFEFNSRSATLDILLVIPMMGTVAYMSRLAGNDQSWTGIFMAGYGLAVWVAGYLERDLTSKVPSCPFWIILGLSFAALGFLTSSNLVILSVLFVKDLSFWIIFHRISGHIQTDTPMSRIGSVMSARNCIITAILTSGEALVGAWSNIVPLATESLLRGFFAAGVGILLLTLSVKAESLADRPIL